MPEGRHWSYEDTEKLKVLYPVTLTEELIPIFRQTAGAIRSKAHRMGLKQNFHRVRNQPSFSPGDVDVLQNVTETEKAYIAGLFDGEGSIYIKYSKQNRIRVIVSIVNTNREVIEWLKSKSEFGKVYADGSQGYLGYRTLYSWCIFGIPRIKSFLQAISPYLIIKRDKAQEIIKMRTAYSFIGHHKTLVVQKGECRNSY